MANGRFGERRKEKEEYVEVRGVCQYCGYRETVFYNNGRKVSYREVRDKEVRILFVDSYICKYCFMYNG